MKISNHSGQTENWYEASYLKEGFDSQRRYPNEELLRYMGRNFFPIPINSRKDIRILELGCGSCANLWMVAKEGFKTYGIDLSQEAIRLGKIMLGHWGVEADLQTGDMKSLPYEDNLFDVVLDVFSTYCLPDADFNRCLGEIERVLKPGGSFFCYTPGKNSKAFESHAPASKIDESTLEGIHRKSSPFYGNFYPFRFVHPEELKVEVENIGMEVSYLEINQRSYYNRQEVFEHVVLEAKKQ